MCPFHPFPISLHPTSSPHATPSPISLHFTPFRSLPIPLHHTIVFPNLTLPSFPCILLLLLCTILSPCHHRSSPSPPILIHHITPIILHFITSLHHPPSHSITTILHFSPLASLCSKPPRTFTIHSPRFLPSSRIFPYHPIHNLTPPSPPPRHSAFSTHVALSSTIYKYNILQCTVPLYTSKYPSIHISINPRLFPSYSFFISFLHTLVQFDHYNDYHPYNAYHIMHVVSWSCLAICMLITIQPSPTHITSHHITHHITLPSLHICRVHRPSCMMQASCPCILIVAKCHDVHVSHVISMYHALVS